MHSCREIDLQVEKIVGIQTNEIGEKLYKVRWKGFSESEDTWEPYENLTDGCDRLIIEYEISQKSKNDENGKHLQPSTSRNRNASVSSICIFRILIRQFVYLSFKSAIRYY